MYSSPGQGRDKPQSSMTCWPQADWAHSIQGAPEPTGAAQPQAEKDKGRKEDTVAIFRFLMDGQREAEPNPSPEGQKK